MRSRFRIKSKIDGDDNKATKFFHLWAAAADHYDDTKKSMMIKKRIFLFVFVFVFVRVKVFAFAREKVPAFGFSPFLLEDCPGINGIYK